MGQHDQSVNDASAHLLNDNNIMQREKDDIDTDEEGGRKRRKMSTSVHQPISLLLFMCFFRICFVVRIVCVVVVQFYEPMLQFSQFYQ